MNKSHIVATRTKGTDKWEPVAIFRHRHHAEDFVVYLLDKYRERKSVSLFTVPDFEAREALETLMLPF